jgi:hypothetical protein
MAAKKHAISELLARTPHPPMPDQLSEKVEAAIRSEATRRSAEQAAAEHQSTRTQGGRPVGLRTSAPARTEPRQERLNAA